MTSLLNFIKIYPLVQKLLGDRHIGLVIFRHADRKVISWAYFFPFVRKLGKMQTQLEGEK
jgi:hypothetical protein